MTNKRKLDEVCRESGISRETFLHFVDEEWIHPGTEWREEDVLRAQLILELQQDFGINDEAIPVVLHLIDQLNALQREITHTFFKMRKSG